MKVYFQTSLIPSPPPHPILFPSEVNPASPLGSNEKAVLLETLPHQEGSGSSSTSSSSS